MVLTLAGKDGDVAKLSETLRESTARTAATADFERSTAVDPRDAVLPQEHPKPARARVWIDLVSPQRATLYFVDEAWERVLIRHVELPHGFDEVAREQIGLIVHSTLQALLSGAKLGVTRQEARDALLGPEKPVAVQKPPPAVAPVRPSSPPWDLRAGALYEGNVALDGPTLAHGPGLSMSLSTGRIWKAGGWATVQLRWPLEKQGPQAGVSLQENAIRALATLEWSPQPSVGVFGAVGPGVDLVRISPTWAEGISAWPSPARWATYGLMRVAMGGRFSVTRDSTIRLAIGLDARSSATEYVAIWNGTRQVVARQDAVQPFALVDFCLSLGSGQSD